jgi:hypothetical protein
MELTAIKKRAIVALGKAREKRYKLREISAKTGVAQSTLSQLGQEGFYFSDELAAKIIDGCKALGRTP